MKTNPVLPCRFDVKSSDEVSDSERPVRLRRRGLLGLALLLLLLALADAKEMLLLRDLLDDRRKETHVELKMDRRPERDGQGWSNLKRSLISRGHVRRKGKAGNHRDSEPADQVLVALEDVVRTPDRHRRRLRHEDALAIRGEREDDPLDDLEVGGLLEAASVEDLARGPGRVARVGDEDRSFEDVLDGSCRA